MRLFCVLVSLAVLAAPVVAACQGTGDEEALAHAQTALERAVLLGGDDIVPKAALGGASIGNVIPVHHPETLEPVYGLATVMSSEGVLIGLIGIDPGRGKTLWYRFGLERENFTLTSRSDAETAVRGHARAHGLGEDIGPGMLVSGRDKRLYWRFETSAGKALYIDCRQTEPAVLGDLEISARDTGCCGSRGVGVVSEEMQAGLLATSGFTVQEILGSAPAAFNISGIPFHYQIEDWYCCLASMQMVFDLYGVEIGQHDIGDVADEDPSYGCYHEGIVRALLFSGMSAAVQNASLQGYVERQLGYACADYWWDDLPAAERYDAAKEVLSAGYPFIVGTWYDGGHTSGHCRVLKGYDDNLDVFILHDPWYYGTMSGPNLLIDQTFFMNDLWVGYWYGESILGAPWLLRPTFPQAVSEGVTFAVDLEVIYPGPYPFDGQRTTYDQYAQISLSAGLMLESPGAVVALPSLSTGDTTVVTWNVIASAGPGDYGMAFHAQGTVDDYHSAYGTYSDSIGGHAYETVEVTGSLAAAWESEERLTNDDGSSHTCFPGGRAVVVEDNGTVHVVWEETGDGDSEIYYKRRWGGAWGPDVRLTNTSGLSWNPCIARGSDGRLHVAWSDSRDGNHEIYYKYRDPVGGWSADERVSTYTEPDFRPSIAVGDTAVYVAWQRQYGGGLKNYIVMCAERTASGWGGTMVYWPDVDNSPMRDSYGPSVAYGTDGLLHCLYERATANPPNENERVCHKSWHGAGWSIRTAISSGVSYGRTPAVAAGPDSVLHAVWQDGENTGGDIFYAEYDGSAWQPAEQIVTGGTEAATPSVAVGKDGEVHVVWADNRHGEAEIYYKSKQGATWSQAQRLTRAPEMSILPTVAANQVGQVCVVWTDLRDGNPEIYCRCLGSESGAPGLPGTRPADSFVYMSEPHPVPFEGEVRFSIHLREASEVTLDVFDVRGRRARSLAGGACRMGVHHHVWDGKDDAGRAASAGVYFVCCRTPRGNSVRRAVLVR